MQNFVSALIFCIVDSDPQNKKLTLVVQILFINFKWDFLHLCKKLFKQKIILYNEKEKELFRY